MKLPKWMYEYAEKHKEAILKGEDVYVSVFHVERYEKGDTDTDEPPGLNERAYQLWLLAGGKVIDTQKPVTMDDL